MSLINLHITKNNIFLTKYLITFFIDDCATGKKLACEDFIILLNKIFFKKN